MLRVKVVENNNNGEKVRVAVGDRAGFKRPCFFPDDDDIVRRFRTAVFSWSDERQLETLEAKKEPTEDDELKKAYIEKHKELSGYANDKLVKLVGFGLDFGKLKTANDHFQTVYNKAVKYQKAYIDTADWSDDRKKAFNDVRDAMITCFKAIYTDSIFSTENPDFQLKISSKHVNSFLSGVYNLQGKYEGKASKGDLIRGKVYKSSGLLKGYKAFCDSVCHAIGLTVSEGKVVYVSASEEG